MDTRRFSARAPFLILVVAIALSGLTYSQKPPAWKGSIAKEGGIVVVKNPAKPLYGPEAFSLVEELAIGGDAGPDALLASITSIAEGPDGAIFVLDQEDLNVKAFDRAGKYLRTISRQGQGPGELSAPISVHWTAAGELAVVDARRRILFFDAAGKHLRDVPAVDLSFFDIRPDAKGNYYGYFVSVFDENPRYELRKLDGALKALFPIESSPTQDAARDGFDPFFPVLRWAVLPGGGVVCGHAVKSELRVYDAAGKLVRRIGMVREPVAVAKEDIDERTEGMAPETLKSLKVPGHYPSFRYILSDDAGRIYVLCWERPPGRKGYYVDVFDPEGRYVVRAAVPDKQPLILGDRLYAAEEDAEGNPVLKRYKIVWKL